MSPIVEHNAGKQQSKRKRCQALKCSLFSRTTISPVVGTTAHARRAAYTPPSAPAATNKPIHLLLLNLGQHSARYANASGKDPPTL